jgi:hypothetical protein
MDGDADLPGVAVIETPLSLICFLEAVPTAFEKLFGDGGLPALGEYEPSLGILGLRPANEGIRPPRGLLSVTKLAPRSDVLP